MFQSFLTGIEIFPYIASNDIIYLLKLQKSNHIYIYTLNA